jgi:hypothetical protein
MGASALPEFERRLGAVADRLLGGDGLDGADLEEGSNRPLDRGPFDQLLALARHERVTGVLAAVVRTGGLAVTDDQREQVAQAHRAAMAVALVLERLLLDTSETLTGNSVDHAVLKGSALAHLVYPDPGFRDFGDVDILVAPGQMPLAVRLLTVDGRARRQAAELARHWDRDFAKSVTLSERSGYEIDLHRTIAPGVFGLRIDPAGLLQRTQPFEVGGVTLRALSPEGQLLQACLHTAAGNRRVWLSSVCDIAALARSGQVDLARFHEMVVEWRAAAAVEEAVALVRQRLGGADVSRLLRGLRVAPADRRRLARYGTGAGFSGPALTGFAGLPPARWPAYARALLWPSAANLADRGLTRTAHLRRLASHVRA